MDSHSQKFMNFELKASENDEGNVITGYGSVFGNVDRGGDVVAKDAFTKSLSQGRKIKMLWQHDPEKPIGVWDSVEEDEHGLKVSGRIDTNTQKGREALSLIKMGAMDGLSIGYRTVESEVDAKGIRTITEAELWEISVVTFPMNESATIDATKAATMTKTDLEKWLVKSGLSRSVAKALLSKGFDGLSKKSEADEEAITTGDEAKADVEEAITADEEAKANEGQSEEELMVDAIKTILAEQEAEREAKLMAEVIALLDQRKSLVSAQANK